MIRIRIFRNTAFLLGIGAFFFSVNEI